MAGAISLSKILGTMDFLSMHAMEYNASAMRINIDDKIRVVMVSVLTADTVRDGN